MSSWFHRHDMMPRRSSLDEAPNDPDDKDHESLVAEVAEVAGVQAKSHVE